MILRGQLMPVGPTEEIKEMALAAQVGQVGRNARLAEVQDFLQFSDGKLFTLEQQQDAQPVRVGCDFEDFHNGRH